MSILFRWTLLLGCCLGLSGCWPAQPGGLDEQKESNFQSGKNRVQDRDYDGAIEAFEKALEVNPHSASAHFELAVIYDQQKADFATALYHYEKARRLRPAAYPAEIAKDRIEVCKRELAKSVTQTPAAEYLQRELDKLTLQNQQLRQQVTAWENYYRGRVTTMPVIPNFPVAPPAIVPAPQPATSAVMRVEPRPVAPPVRDPVIHTAVPAPAATLKPAGRTHKIAAGDTLSRIANQYRVTLPALRAANPGLDDRRIRVGQTVVIPAN